MLYQRKNLVASVQFLSIFRKTLSSVSNNENDVIFQDINNKGVVILNRPKVLNAVNFSMIKKLYPQLVTWEKEEKILVLIKGAGGKAFCAGGDIKSMFENNILTPATASFFKQVYLTNGLVGNYKVPYVALMDGIVFGGALGVCVHGLYRVVTEKSVFAMPETQIGHFPDTGATYFFPRMKGKLGVYLALTGCRLKGADILKAGIATHYVPGSSLQDLERDLLNTKDLKEINNVLRRYSVEDKNEFTLAPVLKQIDRCFSGSSVETIISELDHDGTQWASDSLNLLNKMSPTSLKIMLKAMEYGSKMNLQECLQMEYRMVMRCLTSNDFPEGVRALLIDKDLKPRWNPSKLSEVSEALVDSYFANLPRHQELKFPIDK